MLEYNLMNLENHYNEHRRTYFYWFPRARWTGLHCPLLSPFRIAQKLSVASKLRFQRRSLLLRITRHSPLPHFSNPWTKPGESLPHQVHDDWRCLKGFTSDSQRGPRDEVRYSSTRRILKPLLCRRSRIPTHGVGWWNWLFPIVASPNTRTAFPNLVRKCVTRQSSCCLHKKHQKRSFRNISWP